MQAFGYFLPNKMKFYLLYGAMRRLCSHKYAKKNRDLLGSYFLFLRKRGDSNPRYSYPYDSLANCWFQPLTHPSIAFGKWLANELNRYAN